MASSKADSKSQAALRLVSGSGDNMDKQKALEAALGQIERAFGQGSVMKLGEGQVVEIESISTGSLGLDIGLGIGGLPRGRIIEIYGPESSGKTTLTLHCVAEEQKKGKLFLQMAQLYTDKESWSRVIEFSNKALAAGGLSNPGTAHLLKGMAYFELGNRESALAAFTRGSKYPKSQRQAGQWINHINNSQ